MSMSSGNQKKSIGYQITIGKYINPPKILIQKIRYLTGMCA